MSGEDGQGQSNLDLSPLKKRILLIHLWNKGNVIVPWIRDFVLQKI